MNCSTPGLPVHHQLSEFTQTHVHWVGDAIQPSHPLSSPSPLALSLAQHQGLFIFFVLLIVLFFYFYFFIFNLFFFLFLKNLLYFTILYWFCHTSWICHGYTRVPNPEPPSHFPPHIISLGHPSAPAASILYPAANLDRWFVSLIFKVESKMSLHNSCLLMAIVLFTALGWIELSSPQFFFLPHILLII